MKLRVDGAQVFVSPDGRVAAGSSAGCYTPAIIERSNVMKDEACPHQHLPRRRKPVSEETLDKAARLFRAVADVSRLKVLDQLADAEVCVSELAEELQVGVSTVSQQLKVLHAERIISRRREGKHIYYRLADQHIASIVRSVLEHVDEDASDDVDR